MEYKTTDWRNKPLECIVPEDGDLMTREQFILYLKKLEADGDFSEECDNVLYYYNSSKCLLAQHNDITGEVFFY